MKHVSDGWLRRLADDPLILGAADRRHFESCDVCRARLASIRADGQAVAALLSAPAPPADADAALGRLIQHGVRRRAPLPPVVRSLAARVQINRTRAIRTLAAAAIAAVLVIGMVVSGLAANLLTIFEPRQVTAVPVTATELQGLPDLSAYGTISVTQQPVLQSVPDAQAAASQTHLRVLQPATLPATVTGGPAFAVLSRGSGSFTFSAARAQAAARQQGKPFPPMPANIDGSTLYLTVGPALIESFGATSVSELPPLVIAESRVPTVQSTGVSVKQLEDYLLRQPGISPSLAAQIKAMGDPSQTLPIPIPVNMATSHPVSVQGVQGVMIGDSSGLGSAVVWVKDGVVYAVGGTLSEDQVLQVANSLR